jgi:hypothetical protein
MNWKYELAFLRKDLESAVALLRKDLDSALALLRKDVELSGERLEHKIVEGDSRIEQRISRILWSVVGAIVLQLAGIGTAILLALRGARALIYGSTTHFLCRRHRIALGHPGTLQILYAARGGTTCLIGYIASGRTWWGALRETRAIHGGD